MQLQVSENMYDLEANLAILKLYQFFPNLYKPEIVCWILLKSLTNLPNTDFVLCRCLLGAGQVCQLFTRFTSHGCLRRISLRYWSIYMGVDKYTTFLLIQSSNFLGTFSLLNLANVHITLSRLRDSRCKMGQVKPEKLQLWATKSLVKC